MTAPDPKSPVVFCSCKASQRDGQHMAWCNAFKTPAPQRDTKSAPVQTAPQNNAERLPSSDAAGAGAGTARVREALEERQRVVIEWGERCFGADHMRDKIVRAARFLEEAAELAQASGLPHDHATRALTHVYSRPAGDPAQEIGGSANTLMALCGALGLSLDDCQMTEIARVLAKDPAHFAARNQTKLREVDAALTRSPDRDAVAWLWRNPHGASGKWQLTFEEPLGRITEKFPLGKLASPDSGEMERLRERLEPMRDALTSACMTLQQFLDTFGDLGDRTTQADLNDWLEAAGHPLTDDLHNSDA